MDIQRRKAARQVYGRWHGGSGYSPPYAEDIEIFHSLKHAREVLSDRRNFGYNIRQAFNYVFKDQGTWFLPTVGDDSFIEVWFDLDLELLEHEDLPEPDRYVYFGPRYAARSSEFLPEYR